MKDITLKEAKRLYASTGFCEHTFTEPISPFGCPNIKIKTCKVCAEELNRVYC